MLPWAKADTAKAKDADALTHYFIAYRFFPARLPRTPGDLVGILLDFFCQPEQQPEGVLGNSCMIDPRGKQDRKLLLGGMVDINLVEPDAIFADDFQCWQGLVDHCAGDYIIATEKPVKSAGQAEHLFFR